MIECEASTGYRYPYFYHVYKLYPHELENFDPEKEEGLTEAWYMDVFDLETAEFEDGFLVAEHRWTRFCNVYYDQEIIIRSNLPEDIKGTILPDIEQKIFLGEDLLIYEDEINEPITKEKQVLSKTRPGKLASAAITEALKTALAKLDGITFQDLLEKYPRLVLGEDFYIKDRKIYADRVQIGWIGKKYLFHYHYGTYVHEELTEYIASLLNLQFYSGLVSAQDYPEVDAISETYLGIRLINVDKHTSKHTPVFSDALIKSGDLWYNEYLTFTDDQIEKLSNPILAKSFKNLTTFLGPCFVLVPAEPTAFCDLFNSSLVFKSDPNDKTYEEYPMFVDDVNEAVYIKINEFGYKLVSTGIYPHNLEFRMDGDNVILTQHSKKTYPDLYPIIIEDNIVKRVDTCSGKATVEGIFVGDELITIGDNDDWIRTLSCLFNKRLSSLDLFVGNNEYKGKIRELDSDYRKKIKTVFSFYWPRKKYSKGEILLEGEDKIYTHYLVISKKYKEQLTNPIFKKLAEDNIFFIGPKFILKESKDFQVLEKENEAKRLQVKIINVGHGFSTMRGYRLKEKLFVRLTDAITGEFKYAELVDTGIEAENLKITETEDRITFYLYRY